MTSWQLKCVQLMTDTGGDAGGGETECGSIASDCSNKDNGGTSDIHSDPCDIRETYLLCGDVQTSDYVTRVTLGRYRLMIEFNNQYNNIAPTIYIWNGLLNLLLVLFFLIREWIRWPDR